MLTNEYNEEVEYNWVLKYMILELKYDHTYLEKLVWLYSQCTGPFPKLIESQMM